MMQGRARWVVALVGWLAAATSAAAQGPLKAELEGKLQTRLQRLATEAAGVVGIGVVDLTSGRRWGVNDTLVFPQGSAIKIPLLIELFRRADAGELTLSERVEIAAADRTGGSSLLQHFAPGGSAFSLHDLAIPMVVLSDNTATNMLIDRVGMERVTATMARLGFADTQLRRKMIRSDEQARGNENVSTARNAVDIMARLSRCDVSLTPASCAEVMRLLELPKGGPFRDAIPSSVPVAWKPGGLEGVSTAWGVVRLPGAPYAISVMETFGTAEVGASVREISAAVFRHFSQVAGATDFGTRLPSPVTIRRPVP